ncbi:hypothetical protein PPYR_11769 [Photinus pyralis]|uniref:Minichromosome loss protein Mcl1 middle region domain-containing protein n=1 Tax=Photinus pyralis TaxID=7054 RepID=A0A1Y1M972_PHOPY|nr:WD repeat and HMG-box DNA-binding protein 1 [Photinus pyralis]KAB0794930.1 hypothetical protein PPYR_11769 [Photinus pyralis]
MERKETRYAHSDGHTDVCYTEDGTKLITCGTDGDIRIWSGFEDDDPFQTCVGEWAHCVRQKGDRLFIATDKNNVQITTYPDAERDGILIRFTAHVNHMDLGKNHDFIAVVSEDMEVKVINLTKQSEILSFPGLSGPPLSVSLNPKARMLAVASGDGMLRVWNVEDSSLLKEIDCVPKVNSFMNADCLSRIHFDPVLGRSLAYPNKNNVIIVDTTSWSEKLILMCSEVESTYSIVQFSPCGELMAGATQDGSLVVWHITSQNVIGVTKHPKSVSICSIAWDPKGNGEIAFCDVQGQLGIVTNCLKPVIDVSASHVKTATVNHDDQSNNEVDFEDYQFEDDDEDNENAVSIEKLKKEVMGDDSESEIEKASTHVPSPRPRTPEIPLQSVFMPSSTPEHLNPRYLCWNEVGIVRSYRNDIDDEGAKSIEVEFHDSSLHNSMMIQNFHGYTMGSLSSTALAIANSNLVAVVPLNAGAKEWNINIEEEEEEEIICIACSDNLVCLGTSNNFIRVYSIYGTQKGLFAVPGPLVCMTARSSMLLSAYHSSLPRNGDQCISMILTKLDGICIENKDLKSALRPETTLSWLGFSDCDTPALQDSSGLLYLYPESCNVWLPICDTKKKCSTPSDSFFITAMYESFQSLRGIRCRGSVYPSFTPRPTLSEIPLEPPFLEMNTEKSQLEANLFMWSSIKVADVEKKIKETALKTFALACRNNLDQRALELVTMLSNPQLVTLATKYASKLNRRRLAEKLVEMASMLHDDGSNSNETLCSSDSLFSGNNQLNLSTVLRRSVKVNNTKVSSAAANGDSQQLHSSVNDTSVNNNESIPNISNMDISVDSNTSLPKVTNPFLKSLKKKTANTHNPLSLTDKFAGYVEEDSSKSTESKGSMFSSNSEKRKQPEHGTEKQKDKQRKLNSFIFTKRS